MGKGRDKTVEQICDDLLWNSPYGGMVVDEDEQDGPVMKYFDFHGNCVSVNSETKKIVYTCRHGFTDTDQCPDCCH